MKNLKYLAVLTMILVACTSKNKTPEQATSDPASPDFNGEYEWYAGPVGENYLYYKLSIKQAGDSIGGSVFSAFYLSKNDQGYYTMPAASIMNEISGRFDGKDAIVYLGKVLDSARMDNKYQFPDVRSLFGEDAEGDAVQTLYRTGKSIQIRFEEDTAFFEPVKKN